MGRPVTLNADVAIFVRVPRELKERFEQAAKRAQCSQSEYFRRIVEAALSAEP